MAYVREKKVPGKDGKSYSYYQLVEGKRVDGKVRQRVIAHLGKHDSIEAARASAIAPLAAREAGVVPNHVDRLKELNAEYLTHFKAYAKLSKESTDIDYELWSLKGKRSRDATAQRARLKERQAEIAAPYDKAQATMLRAAEIFDALSPEDQERIRALPAPLGVINHLESILINHLESIRRPSRILRR